MRVQKTKLKNKTGARGLSEFVEKNQKPLIIFFLLIVIFLLFFLVKINHLKKNINQDFFQRKIPISIIVGSSNMIFVNAQTDFFNLGGGPPGSSITANFNITNIIDRDVLIKLSVEGSLKEWISFSENNFLLMSNQTKNIILLAKIPDNASQGTYNDSFVVIKHYLK